MIFELSSVVRLLLRVEGSGQSLLTMKRMLSMGCMETKGQLNLTGKNEARGSTTTVSSRDSSTIPIHCLLILVLLFNKSTVSIL